MHSPLLTRFDTLLNEDTCIQADVARAHFLRLFKLLSS